MKKRDFEFSVLFAESERENADLHCTISTLKRVCWKKQADCLKLNWAEFGVTKYDDAVMPVSEVLAVLGVCDNPELKQMIEESEREQENDTERGS